MVNLPVVSQISSFSTVVWSGKSLVGSETRKLSGMLEGLISDCDIASMRQLTTFHHFTTPKATRKATRTRTSTSDDQLLKL